jgi:elongation of very long chain fatty acids protein 6
MTTMFEQNYDSNFGLNFTKEHPYLPLGITFSYLSACYFGQQYMKNRPAYDLQSSLACWNLFLSTFSFIGMLRTVPQLIYNLNSMSLQDNLCTDPKESFANGACGLWVQLFIFSKTPELIDTFFIVARKKPLLFLHWYHHVTVLLFCWHSYSTEASTGLFFVAMNYSVHAVMYGYYFLMAVNAKPKWLNPGLITLSQISQMVIGTSLCAMTYSLLGTTNCAVKRENVVAGGLMYGSYLYLFCEFACKRFLTTKKVKKLCD